jgi:hypothetical protein
MSNIARFNALLSVNGSDAEYHREGAGTPCPCLTSLGYRNLKWHQPVEVAYEPGDVPFAAVASGGGNVTGSVRYVVGYRWEIPGHAVFDKLTTFSAPLITLNEIVSVIFEEFHAADFPPDPVTSIRLYRSLNDGALVQIGQWADIVPPVNENNLPNVVGPAPVAPPPMCNEQGLIPTVLVSLPVKAFIQPVQAGAVRRLTAEYAQQLFGEVEMDDHLGIFPLSWNGVDLDFFSWSMGGEDYVRYDGRRYIVVSGNKIPDPSGGGPHHWEVGLRLVKTERNVG